MSTYLGADVWLTQPHRVLDARETWDRGTFVVASPAGAWQLERGRDAPAVTRPVQWACRTRAEIVAARTFLAARLGAYAPFWMPTYVEDFQIVDQGFSGWSYVDVRTRGYARYVWPVAEAFRHVIALRVDGGAVAGPWRVGRAVENADGTERLFTDGTGVAPGPFTTSRWLMCSCLYARLATDEVQWRWVRPDYAILSLTMMSLPQETPA